MVQAIKQCLKRNGLLVMVSVLFAACNNDRCEEVYALIPFSEEYKNWFKHSGNFGTSVYKKAKASSGLEESIGIGKSASTESIKGPHRPCYYPSGNVIAIGYNSTLYNNIIGVFLLQQLEGEAPVLRLKVEERSAEIVDRINMEFQLESMRKEPITIARYSFAQGNTENIQTGAFPEIQLVDSVAAGGRVYKQVYKVSNPYFKANGSAFSLTDFYIDKDFGLVQYVQKDGTVWQVMQ